MSENATRNKKRLHTVYCDIKFSRANNSSVVSLVKHMLTKTNREDHISDSGKTVDPVPAIHDEENCVFMCFAFQLKDLVTVFMKQKYLVKPNRDMMEVQLKSCC